MLALFSGLPETQRTKQKDKKTASHKHKQKVKLKKLKPQTTCTQVEIVRHATAPQGTAGATCFSAGLTRAKVTVNEEQTTPLTTTQIHHTRKDAKNGQRAKTKASSYVSAIPSHELCTSQTFPTHRHKLENLDDKSDSHGTNSEDSKTHRRRQKQRRENNKRKAQSRHTHKKRSVFLLEQQIILHCNSLQILSIPTHTARQGSQCSDKKTARCKKSYIKENATKSATTKTKRRVTRKQQSTKHPNTYQYDWHAWLH